MRGDWKSCCLLILFFLASTGTIWWSEFIGDIKPYLSKLSSLEVKDALAVVFSALLLVVTTLQFLQLKRTNNNVEFQLRAYIAVKAESILSLSSSALSHASFKMRNVGQTPAKAVQSANLDIFPFPLPKSFEFPALTFSNDPSISLIASGDDNHLGLCSSKRIFGETEIQEAMNGKSKRMYLYGIVEYHDIFGIKRFTKFNYSVVFNKIGGATINGTGYGFMGEDQHVEAT